MKEEKKQEGGEVEKKEHSKDSNKGGMVRDEKRKERNERILCILLSSRFARLREIFECRGV